MINFGRQSQAFEASLKGNGNYFYNLLPETRKTLLKRAFGVTAERGIVLRYERNKDGAIIDKENGRNYEESRLEARQFVHTALETFAMVMGVELSQAVHAVVSGNESAFANVVLRHLKKHTVLVGNKVWDTEKGEYITRQRPELDLPQGHHWKGNPTKIDREDVLKAIRSGWDASIGIMTKREAAAEGGEAAIHKLNTEEKAKKTKNWSTSRKNSMKGVEVVNARQKARVEAKVGA